MKKDTINLNETEIRNLINKFINSSMDSEQIAKAIKNLSKEIIMDLIDNVNYQGNDDLKFKLETATEIVRKNRVFEFKKSVEEETYDDFLSYLSKADKAALINDMGLYRFDDTIPYTRIQKKYYDIIMNSMIQDSEDKKEQEENNKRYRIFKRKK